MDIKQQFSLMLIGNCSFDEKGGVASGQLSPACNWSAVYVVQTSHWIALSDITKCSQGTLTWIFCTVFASEVLEAIFNGVSEKTVLFLTAPECDSELDRSLSQLNIRNR